MFESFAVDMSLNFLKNKYIMYLDRINLKLSFKKGKYLDISTSSERENNLRHRESVEGFNYLPKYYYRICKIIVFFYLSNLRFKLL